MRNSKVIDSNSATVDNPPVPLWHVVHLAYPRTMQQYSCIALRWVSFWRIKLPQVFIQRKTLEKREASVNYDLLCEQLESLLNREATNGYELFSMNATHSGLFSISHSPTRSQNPFLRKHLLNAIGKGEEALVLVFKRKA
ncbi:MAG: hypothetical protein K2W99_07350 [Chthoniobacterales bacterium]|nr:hypothetical protein [Chthoniobacterales bacterium]